MIPKEGATLLTAALVESWNPSARRTLEVGSELGR